MLTILCLFLAVLHLPCCAQSFSSCVEQGLLPRSALQASLVVDHRLQGTRSSGVAAHKLSSSGPRAPEHRLSNCGPQS